MAKTFKKPEALSDQHTHYCPGCTHGVIHRLIAEVIDEIMQFRQQVAVITSVALPGQREYQAMAESPLCVPVIEKPRVGRTDRDMRCARRVRIRTRRCQEKRLTLAYADGQTHGRARLRK